MCKCPSNLGYDAKVVVLITFPSAVIKRIVSTVDSIMFILINIFNIQLRAHSFSLFRFWSIYYVSGTVLGAGNLTMKKTDTLSVSKLKFRLSLF